MTKIRRLACVAALALWMGGTSPAKADGCWAKQYRPVAGLASWYGPGFHGKRTANGSRYDQMAPTAASVRLPLGTIVAVKNLLNGRIVELTINDRGPYIKGRIIDLSRGAARRLGIEDRGVAPVLVTPIGCDATQAGYRLR